MVCFACEFRKDVLLRAIHLHINVYIITNTVSMDCAQLEQVCHCQYTVAMKAFLSNSKRLILYTH